MLELPPLGLYVHLPWCVRKCPYCDFNSHQVGDALPEAAYLAALCRDLDRELPWVQGRKLDSVFFGGGTPSLFSAATIGALLDHAAARIGFTANAEITLEANPGTAEAGRFRDYRRAGVNRLSIGVQSFADGALAALGRIHSGRQAVAAVELARQAGFERINIDLMHGLPGQTEADAVADLRQAIALAAGHLSWYQLTIEPNTAFYRKPPNLPTEAVLAAIAESGSAVLAEAGYRRYEISAYARPGEDSRHNRNYWEFGDYLGIGAGAHGKLSDPATGRIVRRRKSRQPRHYLDAADPCVACEAIPDGERPLEFLMNALRLIDGVPTHYFPARTGLPAQILDRRWAALVERGLLESLGQRLTATALGHRFLDTMLESWAAGAA
ncbi:MAG: radical SAM family heme chaperone HemW [Pseudomonadales bacterium]|nr:radical SAM family heme chaperone HemW [Pseudomonadales bacterium]